MVGGRLLGTGDKHGGHDADLAVRGASDGTGWPTRHALLEAQLKEAEVQPGGLRAAHLGITRLVEPRAIHREAVSMHREANPSVRSLLGKLEMPRWYLQGELSDPEPGLQHDLAAMGVGWKVVPKTAHPMGLQNPEGLAQVVAEVVAASWPGRFPRRGGSGPPAQTPTY